MAYLYSAYSPDPVYSLTQKNRLESVQITPTLEGSTIEIKASRPFAFVTYTLTDPHRLILDLVDSDVEANLPERNFSGDPFLRAWYLSHWKPDDAVKGDDPAGGNAPAGGGDLVGAGKPAGVDDPAYVDFLSFEFTQPTEHRVESNGQGLVLRVRPKVRQWYALAEEGPYPEEGQEANPEGWPNSERRPTSVGWPNPGGWPNPEGWPNPGGDPSPEGRFASLGSALEFGLSRHRPVQIAGAEVELAKRKMREARRALYPAATMKASWTTGTAAGTDFREVNAGIQMEQPLYASGRLMETYRQSLVNLQVAEKRGDKVKSDFSLEIAQAYFQLIGAKSTLTLQEELLTEAIDFLEKTQARHREELLTRLELLNVQAQVNQARFQRTTAENDLALSRLKFLQRLNLPPDAAADVTPDATVEVPSEFPPLLTFKPIDLEEALQLAMRYRPDIQLNGLLVEFHEYEERIAKAKGKLKIDLSGFFGTSGSAFETEPLDLGDDYFLGIKATQAWGPHGATVSATTTKTAPRLGQTTRTDTTVYSGEIGILNQLQGLTEVQQAKVNLEKAIHDLEESKASVTQEVQEAYIGYTKALLQLEYAEQKIRFREEQVKILTAQASLNEALPSQVLEATMKLSDEKVAEVQALTNLHVALAKLNKAIGIQYGGVTALQEALLQVPGLSEGGTARNALGSNAS